MCLNQFVCFNMTVILVIFELIQHQITVQYEVNSTQQFYIDQKTVQIFLEYFLDEKKTIWNSINLELSINNHLNVGLHFISFL